MYFRGRVSKRSQSPRTGSHHEGDPVPGVPNIPGPNPGHGRRWVGVYGADEGHVGGVLSGGVFYGCPLRAHCRRDRGRYRLVTRVPRLP